MLTSDVYRQLAEVNRLTYTTLDKVKGRASVEEVTRSVKDAELALDGLRTLLGLDEGESLGKGALGRHLHFVAYYYARGNHDGYTGDLTDIPERDLPAIAEFVQQWERGRLDSDLVAAIDGAWSSRDFRAVVRDAFVHLEQHLRVIGAVSPRDGMSGDKLVNKLLGPTSPDRIPLSPAGLLGPVTTGEEQGVLYLFKGAILLARNASAHRPLDYSPDEAEALVRLVDLCLRLIHQD